jgi:rare lipoprotein A
MYGITAAHKTLPLGTHVRVVNLTNGKQLDVRINDRGPFVRGRIIDLSYAAAKELGIVGPGTAEVEISVLPQTAFGKSEAETESSAQGAEPDDAVFAFQVGAFKNRDNAEEQKRRLEEKYQHVSITHAASASGDIYRVRVGKFSSLDQARDQEKRLLQDGYSDMIIVAE